MVEASAEAEEYDAFIDSLLQRPDSTPKSEVPAPAQAPAQDEAPAVQRAAPTPSPVVRKLNSTHAPARFLCFRAQCCVTPALCID